MHRDRTVRAGSPDAGCIQGSQGVGLRLPFRAQPIFPRAGSPSAAHVTSHTPAPQGWGTTCPGHLAEEPRQGPDWPGFGHMTTPKAITVAWEMGSWDWPGLSGVEVM